MLLYDSREGNIDIYTLKAKKEELKNYKKNILLRLKQEDLFYTFKTNYETFLNKFNYAKNINFNYNNEKKLKHWFELYKTKELNSDDFEIQKSIIDKYIEGEYNLLIPTKTIKKHIYNESENSVYYFLKPEKGKTIKKHNQERTFEIKNMINLPKKLYLLHLIEQGIFYDLIKEDIEEQLKLFDLSFSKRISINNSNDIYSISSICNNTKKIENDSKILKKIVRYGI